jgi:hypothetical protein
VPLRRTCAALLVAVFTASCVALLFPEPAVLREHREQTERLRELRLRGRVGFEWITQDDVAELVRLELAGDYPQQYVDSYRDAFAALGLLSPDLDLLGTMVMLYRDQLIGLYSFVQNSLYVRSDVPPKVQDPSEILVHELVHALQAEHFPEVLALLRGLRHNDDVALAIASAVEGNASLTALGLETEDHSPQRNLEAALWVRKVMLLDVENPTGLLARVPRILRESLIFPYAYGTIASAQAFERAGNPGLSAHLRDAPLSMLRVIDPQDHMPVDFIGFPFELLDAELQHRGCRRGHDNVAGWVGMGALFADHLEEGAELDWRDSWSGDRFVHVTCGDVWELAWFTRWRTPDSARVFAEQYRSIALSVTALAPLSGPPRVHTEGRNAIVLTPGLTDALPLLRDRSEVRSYAGLRYWIADDCFTESPCPTP